MKLPFGYELTADFAGQGWLFIFAFLGLTLLIFLANHQRASASGLSKVWLNLILLLRTLSALIILLLLFNPQLQLIRRLEQPKKIVLLVDESSSMNQAWEGGAESLTAAINEIYSTLASNHDVQIWSMEGQPLDDLPDNYEAERSLFDWTPGSAADMTAGPESFGAVILISDGYLNGGRSPLDQAWLNDLPVYPTLPLLPRSSVSLEVADAYVTGSSEDDGGPTAVIKIRQAGLGGRRITLTSASPVLKHVLPISMVLRPDVNELSFKMGSQILQSESALVQLNVEGSDLSSQAILDIRGQAEKQRILLLSERVNTLHKFLNLSLPDSLYDLVSVVATFPGSVPENLFEKDFDLLVLNQLSATFQNAGLLKGVTSQVAAGCPSIIFLDGESAMPTDWAAVFDLEQNPVLPGDQGSRILQWEQDATDHPFFLGLLGMGLKSADLLRLTPVRTSDYDARRPGDPIINLGTRPNAPAALTLSNDPPLAVFNGKDFWKLFFSLDSKAYVSGLWEYLLSYLADIADFKPVQIKGLKASASMGDQTEFEIQVRDVDGRPISNAEVRAWQVFPSGLEEGLDLVENRPGIYNTQVLATTPGKQQIVTEALRFGELWGQDSSSIELLAFNGENQSRGVDEIFLERLAQRSGGQVISYDPETFPAFPMEIYRFENRVSWAGLRSSLWLIVLITLLSVEWVIRRRQGLL